MCMLLSTHSVTIIILSIQTVAVLKDQHNNAVVTKDSNSGRDSTSGKDDKELLKTQLQQLTAHCDTLESSLTTTNVGTRPLSLHPLLSPH